MKKYRLTDETITFCGNTVVREWYLTFFIPKYLDKYSIIRTFVSENKTNKYNIIMRKIEKKMVRAISQKRNFFSGNTRVVVNKGKNNDYCIQVLLYGNLIYAEINGESFYSDCGWRTPTTASRLRAVGADYTCSRHRNGATEILDESCLKELVKGFIFKNM